MTPHDDTKVKVSVLPGCNILEKVDGKYRQLTGGNEFMTTYKRSQTLAVKILEYFSDPPTPSPAYGRGQRKAAKLGLDRAVHATEGQDRAVT